MRRYYIINEDESKRITVLRSIALIMVIYLHQYVEEISFVGQSVTIARPFFLECFQYSISRIITYIAVPTFYLISSVLLYSKEFTWKENMRKKCRTLVVPYFIWVTIYMVIYFIGQHISVTAQYFANPGRVISQFTVLDFIGAYCGFVGNGLFVNALWFIRDLIILNLFSVIIKKAIDRFPVFVFILTLAYWVMNVTYVFNNESVCFFIFGYYIVRSGKHMCDLDTISIKQIGISYIILVALEYYFHTIGSHAEMAIESLSVVVGIVLVLKISKCIVEGRSEIFKVLQFLASYSFFIYASHDLIQTVYKKLFIRVFAQSAFVQMIEYLVIPILTILTCMGIGILVKRITKKGFALLSGGR